MPATIIKGWKCTRCGYEWKPRKEKPVTCPGCRSCYWDRPRLRDG